VAEKQLHVVFKGRVQGVGFRFTVERIARDLGVGGWAKNLYNGDVEVIAEGQEEILQEFINKIRDYFSRYIRVEQIDWAQSTGNLKNFQIRF